MKISLRALRVNRNLTQREAAIELGVARQTLINWEKGNTYPNGIMLMKICDTYKAEVNDIFL